MIKVRGDQTPVALVRQVGQEVEQAERVRAARQAHDDVAGREERFPVMRAATVWIKGSRWSA